MARGTGEVGSINDPRFAAEMSHARQVWLQALEWRRLEMLNGTTELRVVQNEHGAFETLPRPPSMISKYLEEIQYNYSKGLAYLASPEPGSVALAYVHFRRISEVQRRPPLLPGETL